MGLDGPAKNSAQQSFSLRNPAQSATMVPPFDGATAANKMKSDTDASDPRETSAATINQLIAPEVPSAFDFPDDLNGIPLTNLTNTPMNCKMESFFGSFPPPASVSSTLNQHNGCFPSNTPSTSSDSAGGAGPEPTPGSNCTRLVIRDPFDDESNDPAHQNLPPSSHWFQQPPSAEVSASDGRTWMETVRANGGGEQRPLIPTPSNAAPISLLPQYAFHLTETQRQWLESIYPRGTFSPNYFRAPPMPPPRHFLPAHIPRFVLLPIKGPLPPAMAGKIQAGPGGLPSIPVPVYCGSGGLPVVVFGGKVMPIHPYFLAGAPPPMMPPHPGMVPMPTPMGMTPSSAPVVQTPHPLEGNVNNATNKQQQHLNISGGSTSSSTTTAEKKPKKESAKARKAREAAEKLAAEQQQRQQQEMTVAAAGSSMLPMPTSAGRSPCDAFPAGPPSSVMMAGAGNASCFGVGMAGGMGMGGMAPAAQQAISNIGGQHQQNSCTAPPTPQQDGVFKVPAGRSPSSMKRSSLPPPSFPQGGLRPMSDQRIQNCGLCQHCSLEISEQRKGIQCTAINQGCNRVYHWECADLSPDAFQEFCKDPRLEWICQDCYMNRGSQCVFAI